MGRLEATLRRLGRRPGADTCPARPPPIGLGTRVRRSADGFLTSPRHASTIHDRHGLELAPSLGFAGSSLTWSAVPAAVFGLIHLLPPHRAHRGPRSSGAGRYLRHLACSTPATGHRGAGPRRPMLIATLVARSVPAPGSNAAARPSRTAVGFTEYLFLPAAAVLVVCRVARPLAGGAASAVQRAHRGPGRRVLAPDGPAAGGPAPGRPTALVTGATQACRGVAAADLAGAHRRGRALTSASDALADAGRSGAGCWSASWRGPAADHARPNVHDERSPVVRLLSGPLLPGHRAAHRRHRRGDRYCRCPGAGATLGPVAAPGGGPRRRRAPCRSWRRSAGVTWPGRTAACWSGLTRRPVASSGGHQDLTLASSAAWVRPTPMPRILELAGHHHPGQRPGSDAAVSASRCACRRCSVPGGRLPSPGIYSPPFLEPDRTVLRSSGGRPRSCWRSGMTAAIRKRERRAARPGRASEPAPAAPARGVPLTRPGTASVADHRPSRAPPTLRPRQQDPAEVACPRPR